MVCTYTRRVLNDVHLRSDVHANPSGTGCAPRYIFDDLQGEVEYLRLYDCAVPTVAELENEEKVTSGAWKWLSLEVALLTENSANFVSFSLGPMTP